MTTTLRTVMNRVLTAIGEPTVDPAAVTITDTYQLQVLEFINQIKEEIDAATTWRVHIFVYSGTCNTGQNAALMTGTTERSTLVRIQDQDSGQFIPLAWDTTVSTAPTQLNERPLAEIFYNQTLDTVTTAAPLGDFAVQNLNSGTGMFLLFYPKAKSNRSVKAAFYTPSVTLTAGDLESPIIIPERPLVQGAVWFALEERGEELGQSGMWTEERYRKALDDAVSQDISEQGGLFLVPT